MMKIKGWSLTRKVVSMSVVILVGCNIIQGIITAVNAEKFIKPQMEKQIENTLLSINANIDGDRVEELINNGKEDSYYDELTIYLSNLQNKGDFISLYTIAELEKNNFYYLIDSLPREHEWFMEFGSPYAEGETVVNELEALKNGSFITDVYSYDGVEKCITGFAAIYNSNNKPVALLAIDINGEEYLKSITGLITFVEINIILGGIIIAMFIGFYLVKSLKPMNKIQNAVSDISHGVLNVSLDVETDDEVGKTAAAINSMTLNLREIIDRINTNSNKLFEYAESLTSSSNKLTDSSKQVVLSSSEMTKEVQEQDNQIDVINKKIDNINFTISEIVDNTKKVSNDIEKSFEFAIQGEEIIKKSTSRIITANDSMEVSKVRILELGKRLEDISQFVEAITNISEQTNLLALNAAIESARAGEAGKGFSIVAEEIRKLADESSNITSEITEILQAVNTSSNDVINSINTTYEQIKEGVQTSKDAESYFNSISNSNEMIKNSNINVIEKVESCSSETIEIVDIIKELNENSSKLLKECGKIADNTKEQFESSEEMEKFAVSLMEISNKFNESVKVFEID